MGTRFGVCAVGMAVLLCSALAGTAMAQSTEAEGPAPTMTRGDVYEAGRSVRVASPVEGDVVIAGGSLTVSEPVSQDVLAAGGLVTITADTGDDLRLAGGAVTIIGNVGSDVTAAGGIVTLESGSTVSGKARLAGQLVSVHGEIDGDLSVTGGRITITGRIGGNVEIDADAITIEPGAFIGGNLTYAAPRQVAVGEGAVIEGEIERIEFALGEAESWAPALAGRLKASFGLVVSAVALFLLFPMFTVTVVERVDDSLLKTLGLGLAVLASVPVLILVLLFSGLASALTFVALGLYLALLFGGWLIGVLWVGDVAMRLLGRTPGASKASRASSVVLAALVLLIVGAIPYVGFLSVFLTTLLGIGALSLHFHRRYTA